MTSELFDFKKNFIYNFHININKYYFCKKPFSEIDSDGVFHILKQPSSSITFFHKILILSCLTNSLKN